MAKPAFDVSFNPVPGEDIFTIGSCFARNVEVKLLDRGYKIPALDVFKREEFAAIEPRALNNYGVPSIYQASAWALDPGYPFNEDGNFLEVLPGKFADAHVSPARAGQVPKGGFVVWCPRCARLTRGGRVFQGSRLL